MPEVRNEIGKLVLAESLNIGKKAVMMAEFNKIVEGWLIDSPRCLHYVAPLIEGSKQVRHEKRKD